MADMDDLDAEARAVAEAVARIGDVAVREARIPADDPDPAVRRLRFETKLVTERAERLARQAGNLARQARQEAGRHAAEAEAARHAEVQSRQHESAGRRLRGDAPKARQHRRAAGQLAAAARAHREEATRCAGSVRALADRHGDLTARIAVLEGQAERLAERAAGLAHEKVGHTDQGLWHHKGMQLPAYIQHIANDLIQERGMPMSQAIQMAIGVCQRWARGGGDVTPETRAKAAAAIAEWERLKAQAKVTKG